MRFDTKHAAKPPFYKITHLWTPPSISTISGLQKGRKEAKPTEIMVDPRNAKKHRFHKFPS